MKVKKNNVEKIRIYNFKLYINNTKKDIGIVFFVYIEGIRGEQKNSKIGCPFFLSGI